MRVLLILPPSKSAIYEVVGVTGPPLGLAYLAAVARDEGHDVRIIDGIAERLSLAKLGKRIVSYDPEVVGVTATTATMYDAYRVVKLAKSINPNLVTVMGGPHVTFLPRQTLEECPHLDMVVRGEGEETFRELLDVLEKEGRIEEVRGITYRKEGRIEGTPPRPLIKNLDELPLPALDLLPMELYSFEGKRFGTLITSRGCPFRCIFCSSSRLFGRIWRAYSVNRVIEEVKVLYEEYGVREIEFLDDTFTLNRRRARQIAEALVSEGLDISWTASSRVDTLDYETASAMRRAGAHTLYLGIESGSEETLKFIRKGITVAESEAAVKCAKKAGLKVLGSFIIGFPYEREIDMLRTIALAMRLNLDYAQFTIATPFPGTELWEMAVSKGLLLSKNWSDYTTLNVVVKNLYISPKRIQQMLELAYAAFYLAPKRIIRDAISSRGRIIKRAVTGIATVLRAKLSE
ncbi:MAG: B12-binding domain-containing radical SAM protein [Thermoprotei archaeon]|nr:MAG: B12-binding domain-containing radical SAM protein [Thermoprotei archaeon]